MTFLEIQDAVALKVQDASPELVANTKDYINEAIQQIADEVNLPSLKSLGTVLTVLSQAWVNIKSTITLFSGKLLYVGTSSGGIDIVNGGLEYLAQEYPDLTLTGDIEACTLEGDILWYAPIPSVATSLTIVYQALPATLVSDGNIPSDIPSLLHRDLIVNKTALVFYDHIEDGIEGLKVNKNSAEVDYERALNKLRAWIMRRRVNLTKGVWDV
jgi:hypothetical protein